MNVLEKYLAKIEKLVKLSFKRDKVKKANFVKSQYSMRYSPRHIAKQFCKKFNMEYCPVSGNLVGVFMISFAQDVLKEKFTR